MSTTRTVLLVLSLDAQSSGDRTRDGRRGDQYAVNHGTGRGALSATSFTRETSSSPATLAIPPHAQQRIEDEPGYPNHQQQDQDAAAL